MNTFFTLVVSALLVEAIVNLIKNIDADQTSWKYWASLFVGLAVSLLVAVNWDIDLFKMVGFSEGVVPYVGAILTGIIISRGSNVVADLLGMIGEGK